MTALANRLRLLVGRRRWLKRLVPLTGESTYLPLPGGLRLHVDAGDMRGPSFNVMYGGARAFENYERDEKLAVLSALPEDGVFLDIGANIGLFSLYARMHRPRAVIHAFEPHPLLRSCLALTASQPGIEPIRAHAIALGDRTGELELFFDETDSGGHSTLASTLTRNRGPARSARVESLTLDAFRAREHLTRVDVIKIDVQGAEAAVIRGGRETISRLKPRILIEFDFRSDDVLAELEGCAVRYRAHAVPAVPGAGNGHDLDLGELRARFREELARGRLQGNYLLAPA